MNLVYFIPGDDSFLPSRMESLLHKKREEYDES